MVIPLSTDQIPVHIHIHLVLCRYDKLTCLQVDKTLLGLSIVILSTATFSLIFCFSFFPSLLFFVHLLSWVTLRAPCTAHLSSYGCRTCFCLRRQLPTLLTFVERRVKALYKFLTCRLSRAWSGQRLFFTFSRFSCLFYDRALYWTLQRWCPVARRKHYECFRHMLIDGSQLKSWHQQKAAPVCWSGCACWSTA